MRISTGLESLGRIPGAQYLFENSAGELLQRLFSRLENEGRLCNTPRQMGPVPVFTVRLASTPPPGRPAPAHRTG